MPKRKKKRINKKVDYLSKKIKIFIFLLLIGSVVSIGYYTYKLFYSTRLSFNNNDYSRVYTVRGVDLSHHNPIIDWSELYAENIGFVYLKATEGITHLDRNYIYNYESAKKNNLKVGTYHFYSFGISGKEQAKHFIKTAKCESGDFLPAIDVEHSSVNLQSKDKNYIMQVVAELKVLEKELHEYYGVRPVIYTNKKCYKLYIKNNFKINPIWICDLHKEPTEIKNWIIWQFSHKGQLPGVTGDIDFNYFRFSKDKLADYLLP